MAGVFTRLGNLWRGFLSIWISDVEKAHPEIAYENAINSMIEKYSRLKSATAAIIRRREEHRRALQEDERRPYADRSRSRDRRRNEPGRPRRRPHSEEESAHGGPRRLQGGARLRPEGRRIGQVVADERADRDPEAEGGTRVDAREDAVGPGRIKIQEQIDGLSVDAEVKALDGVREHIRNTIAEANLGRELGDSSLDARLAALRNQSGDVQARQQLAELKAKRAAQQASQGTKTL